MLRQCGMPRGVQMFCRCLKMFRSGHGRQTARRYIRNGRGNHGFIFRVDGQNRRERPLPQHDPGQQTRQKTQPAANFAHDHTSCVNDFGAPLFHRGQVL